MHMSCTLHDFLFTYVHNWSKRVYLGSLLPFVQVMPEMLYHVMSKTAQLVVAPWEFGSDEASSPSTATSGRSRKRAAKPHASMSIFHNQYPNIVAKHSHLPQACCIKRINPPLHSDSHV